MQYETIQRWFIEAFGAEPRLYEDARAVVSACGAVGIGRNDAELSDLANIDGDEPIAAFDVAADEAYAATLTNDLPHAEGDEKAVYVVNSAAHGRMPTFVSNEYADRIAFVLGKTLPALADAGQVFVHPVYSGDNFDGSTLVVIRTGDAVIAVAPVVPSGVEAMSNPRNAVTIRRKGSAAPAE